MVVYVCKWGWIVFYMLYILCKAYSFQSYVSSYSILQHKRKLSRQLHVFELPLLMLNGENCCVTGTTWLSFKQISEIKFLYVYIQYRVVLAYVLMFDVSNASFFYFRVKSM